MFKKYTVKVWVPEHELENFSAYNIHCALNNDESGSLTNFGAYVESVTKYDPESEAVHTKIGAIKRIRGLLQCSLKDAKFLADTAETSGHAAWANVTVNCVSVGMNGTSQFTVADHS